MGTVITFYSFKGGVGRTMALANIAILLAKRRLRVLAIDADLEAPGLNRYFNQLGLPPVEERPGLLELLTQDPDDESTWGSYTSTVEIEDGLPLTIMTSGRRDETYVLRVLEFDWEHFFREEEGGERFENLREEWKQAFDIVLIDSRTGITDSGGVFTIQMPDILVLVANPSHQSIGGVREVAERAQAARQKLPYDRMPLSILPILSRLDTRAEYEQAREWLDIFATEMDGFYADWLPKPFTPRQIIEQTKLPYVAYFGFGEKLPVLIEGTSDPEGLGFAYESLAALLAKDLAGAEQIIEKRDTYVTSEPSRYNYDILIWASPGLEHWGTSLGSLLKLQSPTLRVFSDLEDLLPGEHWPTVASEIIQTIRMAIIVIGWTIATADLLADDLSDWSMTQARTDPTVRKLLERALQEPGSLRILPIFTELTSGKLFSGYRALYVERIDQLDNVVPSILSTFQKRALKASRNA